MVNYGFLIDNRKCIGCHACTIACKAEHDVPIGVNRTWVKYIEKGSYPDTRRLFSVMRCNHCDDAPCVSICPVTALYVRDDGIVDFDKSRCIGCRSCMQACPYDALYIDPETETAAKCNFCSNRVDLGLEPACVVVCPEEAIIAGDLSNPKSKISKLIATETVTVRKPEKGTVPKLFYIDGDSVMLTPSATSSNSKMWSQQEMGVGHNLGKEHKDYFESKGIDLNAPIPRNVYDAPDKGRLWGKEVPSYIFSKSIGAGVGIILSVLNILNYTISRNGYLTANILAIIAMIATAIFLATDLDQPKRFITVLLRPQWKSWLAKGAYIISFYSFILVVLIIIDLVSGVTVIPDWLSVITIIFGILSAVYTAFLFAQAKGRDFWQSPILPIDMLTHSMLTGSGLLLILSGIMDLLDQNGIKLITTIFVVSAIVTILTGLMEVYIPHATKDATTTAHSISSGKWRNSFFTGLLLAGIFPVVILTSNILVVDILIVLMSFLGVFIINRVFVYAPQEIKLS